MSTIETLQSLFTPLDALAFGFFLAAIVGYTWLIGSAWAAKHDSLVGVVQRQRVMWLRNMGRRENRNLDVILLSSLSQGNAFFASTTAIAIGGVAALLGSGERVQQVIEKLPLVVPSPAALWECKLLLIMAIFIFAFFKFAWAFRLSHYCSIMIGATPILTEDNGTACDEHADRTAAVVGLAGDHANSGLRAFYYAFAVLAWFFSPLAFIAATLWVGGILVRRDFFSRSRRLIAGDGVAKVVGHA